MSIEYYRKITYSDRPAWAATTSAAAATVAAAYIAVTYIVTTVAATVAYAGRTATMVIDAGSVGTES